MSYFYWAMAITLGLALFLAPKLISKVLITLVGAGIGALVGIRLFTGFIEKISQAPQDFNSFMAGWCIGPFAFILCILAIPTLLGIIFWFIATAIFG